MSRSYVTIQDNDRGWIVGRRTFGKGLVQQQLPLGKGDQIRLTTARYYTPTGRSIQKPYNTNDKETYFADLQNRFKKGEMKDAKNIPLEDSLAFKTPKGRTFRTDLDIPGKMSDQIRAHFGLARKSIGAGSMKTWDPASSTEAEKEAAKKRKEADDKASAERKKEEAEKEREKNRQKQDGS